MEKNTAGEILTPYAINSGRREVVILWEDAITAMEKYASQFTSQPSSSIDAGREVPAYTDLPEDLKERIISEAMRVAGETLLTAYIMTSLQKGMNCIVHNEPTKEQFSLSFKKTIEPSTLPVEREWKEEDLERAAMVFYHDDENIESFQTTHRRDFLKAVKFGAEWSKQYCQQQISSANERIEELTRQRNEVFENSKENHQRALLAEQENERLREALKDAIYDLDNLNSSMLLSQKLKQALNQNKPLD